MTEFTFLTNEEIEKRKVAREATEHNWKVEDSIKKKLRQEKAMAGGINKRTLMDSFEAIKNAPQEPHLISRDWIEAMRELEKHQRKQVLPLAPPIEDTQKERKLGIMHEEPISIPLNECETYWCRIYIAGDCTTVYQVCREFCQVWLCVNVQRSMYIYTGGAEEGAVVELINYPRFPSSAEKIMEKAEDLGWNLLERCCQHSFTIMTPDRTYFYRTEDKQ